MKQLKVSKISLEDLEVLQNAGYDVSVVQTTLSPTNPLQKYIYEEEVKKYKNKYRYELPTHHAAKIEVCKVPHVKGNRH